MPRVRKRGPDTRQAWRYELDLHQELALTLGPVADGFDSEDEARSAWGVHGERIMAEHPAGSRPAGWWAFVAGEPRPTLTDRELPVGWSAEAVALAERGELSAEEFRTLERKARRVGHPRRWSEKRLTAFFRELRQQGTEEKP